MDVPKEESADKRVPALDMIAKLSGVSLSGRLCYVVCGCEKDYLKLLLANCLE